MATMANGRMSPDKCVSGKGSKISLARTFFKHFFMENKYNFMHFERHLAFQNA